MQGSVATSAPQVVQVDRRYFLKPDSALVRTALDLVSTHVADGAEGETESCGLCGLRFPCPTVQHARLVVNAGGLLDLVAGPAGRRPDSAGEPAPDRPVERTPDVTPDVTPDATSGTPDIAPDMPDVPDAAAERGPDSAIKVDDDMPLPDPVGAA